MCAQFWIPFLRLLLLFLKPQKFEAVFMFVYQAKEITWFLMRTFWLLLHRRNSASPCVHRWSRYIFRWPFFLRHWDMELYPFWSNDFWFFPLLSLTVGLTLLRWMTRHRKTLGGPIINNFVVVLFIENQVTSRLSAHTYSGPRILCVWNAIYTNLAPRKGWYCDLCSASIGKRIIILSRVLTYQYVFCIFGEVFRCFGVVPFFLLQHRIGNLFRTEADTAMLFLAVAGCRSFEVVIFRLWDVLYAFFITVNLRCSRSHSPHRVAAATHTVDTNAKECVRVWEHECRAY